MSHSTSIRAKHTNLSTTTAATSPAAQSIIDLERKHGAYNYHPLPVVIKRGQGTRLWDVDGREYLDFLAAYSAVNQGHCHPYILGALTAQAAKLTLTSRAFHNDLLYKFQRRLCDTFGYDKCLPMNTGVEGGETAVKLARRWGYEVKRIADGRARVVFAKGNFWGRTISAVSSSTDATCRNGFGPFVPGFDLIAYDDLDELEKAVSHPDVCAFMVEPIQGEAGIVVPQKGYLAKAHDICKRNNVLLIADEVQTGLGRTGRMLCADHDGVKPDLVVLGKALSGGMYPVSAVLGSNDVLGLLRPGEHGSTYGGNPLACAVGMAALDVIEKEKLCENSKEMGEVLRKSLLINRRVTRNILSGVRGRGLMNALVIRDLKGDGTTAWDVCMEMARNGVLAKPTHGHIIRLAPPLSITKEEVEHACVVIREAMRVVAVAHDRETRRAAEDDSPKMVNKA
eukprot:GFKZ01001749.1.p1 GENE.GFKZ01001749.1~~GFKZ01001749.1.p1  ORF type:complete len:494 (-),score=72.80 GFKZ01001749.1:123-1481(-)